MVVPRIIPPKKRILTTVLEERMVVKIRGAGEEGCKQMATREAPARTTAARKRKILGRRRRVAMTLKRTMVPQAIRTQKARRKKRKRRRRV